MVPFVKTHPHYISVSCNNLQRPHNGWMTTTSKHLS